MINRFNKVQQHYIILRILLENYVKSHTLFDQNITNNIYRIVCLTNQFTTLYYRPEKKSSPNFY